MSHENPSIIKLYDEWYTEGYGKGKAHQALHTSYVARERYPKE